MAAEQDILSLGLNIDSFDAQKKAQLKEYITLFDTLTKYDGKIFNPVMGDGLQKFNTSIAETNRLVDELNSKLVKLNTNKVTNILPTDQIKNFTKETEKSTKAVKDHGNEMASSEFKVAQFGKELTKGLSTLRTLAYILPGIGIAGIFNAAYQGVIELVQSFGLLENKEEQQIIFEEKMNSALSEQLKLLNDIYKKRDETFQLFGNINDFGSNAGLNTLQSKKDIIESDESRGISKDILLPKEVDAASKRLNDAIDKLERSAPTDLFHRITATNMVDPNELAGEVKKDLEKRQFELISIVSKLNINQLELAKNESGKDTDLSKKEIQNRINEAKAEYELKKQEYDQSFGFLKEYYDSQKNLTNKQKELERFNSDEARKLLVKTSEDNISTRIAENKKILDDDKNFHDERQKAILSDFKLETQLANIYRINVTGTNENPNLSATVDDIKVAINKQNDDEEKARIKRDKDLEKNDIEFYQRQLKATTEISKYEIEQDAIANEKIFQNEQHSLSERLEAYERYIIDKQKIRDKDYDLEIQKSASKAGGKTSLTPEEQQQAGVHRTTEDFNIQANAEKQVYDIVHTSLEKQLKDIIDTNLKEAKINKDAYAAELAANNKRFEDNIFSYESFKKNKEQIDKKYGVIYSIEDEIKKDIQNVSRLKDLYDDLLQAKKSSDRNLEIEKDKMDKAKSSGGDVLGTTRHYDEEVGRNNAINDAILKAQKDLADAEKKGEDDRVKAAKARYDQLIEFEKEYADNKRKIEEGLWDLADKLINRNVDNEIKAIEDVTRARDEQYSLEEDAVKASSLSAKDKAALDIQLSEQKLEADKAATLEERRLKHEAAEKDRELNIAHILWNTIESVSAALKIAPPAGEILAAERAILGGIEIAQILAVPIPSYKYGTENHKGGYARFAEDGAELVKEPGKHPYIALTETIAELPAGTKVIPLNDHSPVFNNELKDDSWEQTKFLANQIKKSNKEIKNVFKPTIIIDMGFETRKRQILGN